MAFTPTDPNKAEVRIIGEAPNYGLDFYIPRGERGFIGPVGPQGPAVPTNLEIGEVVTGPETPGIVGPQGPVGPKGDPGGFTSSALGDVNLNTVWTQGLYYPNAGSVISAANNYPVVNVGGYLEVARWSAGSPNYVFQTYHVRGEGATANSPVGSRGFWRRVTNDLVTWSKWVFFGPSRVDQTAGRAIYQWDPINDRDQLIYGDTGWRRMPVLDSSGNSIVSGGSLDIARHGQGVSMSFWALTFSTSGTKYLDNFFPQGWMPGQTVQAFLWSDTNNVQRRIRILNTGFVALYDVVAGENITGVVNYRTTQAWPTSLPGTAFASIPNA